VIKRIFDSYWEDVTGVREMYTCNEGISIIGPRRCCNIYDNQMNGGEMSRAYIGTKRNIKFRSEKSDRKKPQERRSCKWEYNIKFTYTYILMTIPN
jgi:hypothetical protein